MLFQALPTKSAIVCNAPEMFDAVETMTVSETADEENACISAFEDEELTEAKTNKSTDSNTTTLFENCDLVEAPPEEIQDAGDF